MAKLLFYKDIVPLNRQVFKGTKVTSIQKNYSFARETNSMAITGNEFGKASKEFAIAFSRVGDDQVIPIILLGIRSKENLFITDDDAWDARYLPDFAKCYPFIFAKDPEEKGDTLAVCVDQSYSGVGTEDGELLFNEKGENSPYLDKMVALLKEYHSQTLLTKNFTRKLDELDLFSQYSAKFNLKSGESHTLGEFLVVDEKKLRKLEDKKALDLFRSGQLAWIYFHLTSLANIGQLVDKASERE